MSNNQNRSAPVIPVLYDETYRGQAPHRTSPPTITSMASMPNMLGYLRNPSPDTDGSFGICVAQGTATIVSKTFYDSIPEPYRPILDTSQAGVEVNFELFGTSIKALGSIIMPTVLIDASTGKKFCIKIFAFLVEGYSLPMFIGKQNMKFVEKESWADGKVTYHMNFGTGQQARVEYLL